jgi:hypothetical protein
MQLHINTYNALVYIYIYDLSASIYMLLHHTAILLHHAKVTKYFASTTFLKIKVK